MTIIGQWTFWEKHWRRSFHCISTCYCLNVHIPFEDNTNHHQHLMLSELWFYLQRSFFGFFLFFFFFLDSSSLGKPKNIWTKINEKWNKKEKTKTCENKNQIERQIKFQKRKKKSNENMLTNQSHHKFVVFKVNIYITSKRTFCIMCKACRIWSQHYIVLFWWYCGYHFVPGWSVFCVCDLDLDPSPFIVYPATCTMYQVSGSNPLNKAMWLFDVVEDEAGFSAESKEFIE